jgi:DNA-binding LacI/PurR family transcriptional regulator
VTARDVAELAQCSAPTVSLVVNGKSAGRVNPVLERRIWDAIEQLNYRVSPTASALASGLRSTIGFVSPDVTNPFFSLVLEGLLATLSDRLALHMIAPIAGNDYDQATIRQALAGDFAALVLASPGRRILDGPPPDCPVIILDAGGSQQGYPSIDLDVEGAARELAQHLVAFGHRRVAYVGVDRDKASLHLRRDALQFHLAEHGAQFVVPDLSCDSMSIGAAESAVSGAYQAWADAGVTAVVCGDDLLAYGTLRAFAHLGVDVPGEISVVGFDNLPYSELVRPNLTTVDLSARELGVRTADMIQALLRGEDVPETTTLPATVVVRESTGPAPAGQENGGG